MAIKVHIYNTIAKHRADRSHVVLGTMPLIASFAAVFAHRRMSLGVVAMQRGTKLAM